MTFIGTLLSLVAVLLYVTAGLLYMILREIKSLNRHVLGGKTEFHVNARVKSNKNRANRLTDASKQWLQARSAADKEVR